MVRQQNPSTPAPPAGTASAAAVGTSDELLTLKSEFTGPMVQVQLRLPSDMVESLKLGALKHRISMSRLVELHLSTGRQLQKSWVAGRR
jgi:hypothetical protein